MSDSTSLDAKPLQRVAAAAINLAIVLILAFVAERIAAVSGAPNAAARAGIAVKALFGLCVLFWLACGHARTSPGLRLMKLRVVQLPESKHRISLTTALIRPLPFFIFGILVSFPTQLIPPNLGPVQFLLVLASSLMLAANSAPLWSGPNRRSLLDRWLNTRVVQR